MSTNTDKVSEHRRGCDCCALVLAELEALRYELGQLTGLIVIGSIGS